MVPFNVETARKRESSWPTSTGHSASRGLHLQNFLCQETASQMFKAAAGPPGAKSKTHFDQGLHGRRACALSHSAATHVLAGLLSTGMMLIYRTSLWSGHCQRHWRHGNGQAASILAKGKLISLVFLFFPADCPDQVFCSQKQTLMYFTSLPCRLDACARFSGLLRASRHARGSASNKQANMRHHSCSFPLS